MSRRGARVYVGNLSSRTRERDLEHEFDRYGRVERVDLKNGFGFVEFDDPRDADDAIRDLHGIDLDGRRIIVELARGPRSRPAPRGGGYGYRINVENLDQRTSWQDLKDFARKAGDVAFTDVWMDRGKKFGVIEYSSKDDFKRALRELDDQKLDGNHVRLSEDKGRGGGSRSRSRSRSPRRRRSRSRSRSRSRHRSRSRSGKRSRSRSPAKDDKPDDKPADDQKVDDKPDDKPVDKDDEKQD